MGAGPGPANDGKRYAALRFLRGSGHAAPLRSVPRANGSGPMPGMSRRDGPRDRRCTEVHALSIIEFRGQGRFVCTKSTPWDKSKSAVARHPDAVSDGTTEHDDGSETDYYKCPHCGLRFGVEVPQ